MGAPDMSVWTRVTFLSTVFFAATAFAETREAAWMLQTNLLERTEGKSDAALPNVLILGDSISMVCAELGVQTVDLSAIGERNYDKQPDGAHYNDEGNDLLAAAVSAAVESALKRKF